MKSLIYRNQFSVLALPWVKDLTIEVHPQKILFFQAKDLLLTFPVQWALKAQIHFHQQALPSDSSNRAIQSIKLIDKEKNTFTISKMPGTHPESLNKLRFALSKVINFKGFHQCYQPLKKIGKGTFASVYLVERFEDKKHFAVKAFSKEQVMSRSEDKECLFNQIQILRSINHHNLTRLIQIFETQSSIYMVLQYIKGPTLRSLLKNKTTFKHSQLILIFRRLLSALDCLHALNIAHRDIKPDNIMFRDKQLTNPVLIDFGLATNVDKCGTPGFVAPEIVNQVNPNSKVTTSCDSFSMGLIFHLILTGKNVFKGNQISEILANNRNLRMEVCLNQLPIQIQPLKSLIMAMLDPKPSRRPYPAELLDFPFLRSKTNELDSTTCQQRPKLVKLDSSQSKIFKEVKLSSLKKQNSLLNLLGRKKDIRSPKK